MKTVFILFFLSLIFLLNLSTFGQVGPAFDSTTNKPVIDLAVTEEEKAKANQLIPGQYIVVLKDNETARTLETRTYAERQQLMRQEAEVIINRHDILSNKLLHVYGSSILGFSMSNLNDEEVEKLRLDSEVKYVEQDQQITQPTKSLKTSLASPVSTDCSFLKVNGQAYENGSADFGASQYSLSGELIIADDGFNPTADACQPLQNTVTGKVVLIDRGVCEFGFKALQAQNGGAIAVIVANNVLGPAPNMAAGASGGQVTIPVISVSQADSDSLKLLMSQGAVTAELDNQLTVQCTPWGITRVGGGVSGAGKRAWILDGGIDTLHPDLNVNTALSVTFAAGTTSPQDERGHGTHVSGTVAALDNAFGVIGVASGAEVVVDGVFNAAIKKGIHGQNYLLSSESYPVSDISLMLNNQAPEGKSKIVYRNDLARKDLGIQFKSAQNSLNQFSE